MTQFHCVVTACELQHLSKTSSILGARLYLCLIILEEMRRQSEITFLCLCFWRTEFQLV